MLALLDMHLRAGGSFLTALAGVLLIGKWIIDLSVRNHIGEVIRSDGPASHASKVGTPTMGGAAIIASVLASAVIWTDILSGEILVLITCAVLFSLIGAADDLLKLTGYRDGGLGARSKLALQAAASLITVLLIYRTGSEGTTQVAIPWGSHRIVDLGGWYYLLAVVYITGFANSVNLTDGLDGLATGLAGIACAAVLAIALAVSPEIAVFVFGLIGALAGFLVFNWKPALMFMGDTGSEALGGILAVLALLLKAEVALVIIGGVFILETFSVIAQVTSYKLRRKRVLLMAPLHHHFELKGYREGYIVRRFYLAGTVLAVIGIMTV